MSKSTEGKPVIVQIVLGRDDSELLRQAAKASGRAIRAEAKLRLEASLKHFSSIADIENSVPRTDKK